MPRTRELKPAFFQDEDLAQLSRDHRLLFEALWTLADREGRLCDRPAFIKLYSFPFDADVTPDDIDRMLTDLAAHAGGFIRRYGSGRERYIQVENLKKHQHIHPKEAPSVIPSPEAVRELPGITGKAETSQGIMPLPSIPSLPSSPPPSLSASGSGAPRIAAGPLPKLRPDIAHNLVWCIKIAVEKAQPKGGPWAPDTFAEENASRLLVGLGDLDKAMPGLEKKIALFAADPEMQPWTVKKFCDNYNGIGLPKRRKPGEMGEVKWRLPNKSRPTTKPPN